MSGYILRKQTIIYVDKLRFIQRNAKFGKFCVISVIVFAILNYAQHELQR